MKKVITFLLMLAMCLSLCGCKSSDYKEAMAMFESGKYQEAEELFNLLGDYKTSKDMASKCKVKECEQLFRAIGKIDEHSTSKYINASRAYNNLTADEKSSFECEELRKQKEEEYNNFLEAEKLVEKLRGEAESYAKQEAEDLTSYFYDEYRSFKIKSTKVVWPLGFQLNTPTIRGRAKVEFTINNLGLLETYEADMGFEITIENGELTNFETTSFNTTLK